MQLQCKFALARDIPRLESSATQKMPPSHCPFVTRLIFLMIDTSHEELHYWMQIRVLPSIHRCSVPHQLIQCDLLNVTKYLGPSTQLKRTNKQMKCWYSSLGEGIYIPTYVYIYTLYIYIYMCVHIHCKSDIRNLEDPARSERGGHHNFIRNSKSRSEIS